MKKAFVLGLAAVSGSSFGQFFDDFNRADGPLGSNYMTLSGAPAISGNAVRGTAATGITLVNTSAFSGPFVGTTVQADISVDSTTATTLFYAALLLGHNGLPGGGNGIYVKFQRQIAGGFSHVGIYTGNNITSGAITTPGGSFQTFATQFAAARVTVKVLSTTSLYTGIDTNFDNTDDITYNSTLQGSLVVGNQVGLHTYGNTGQLDNFRATAVPEPATMAALGLGALALVRRRRKA